MTQRLKRTKTVFDNEVGMKMFGSKRTEVTKYWRKLHNEHHLFVFLPDFLSDSFKNEAMSGTVHEAD
jgi:hypothetical protein